MPLRENGDGIFIPSGGPKAHASSPENHPPLDIVGARHGVPLRQDGEGIFNRSGMGTPRGLRTHAGQTGQPGIGFPTTPGLGGPSTELRPPLVLQVFLHFSLEMRPAPGPVVGGSSTLSPYAPPHYLLATHVGSMDRV